MSKRLLAILTTASAILASANDLHAQQQSATGQPMMPHSLERLIGRISPDVRAILRQQAAQAPAGTAQKPTADENLIAIATTSDEEADSVTFRYSGSRGSLLTSSLFSYQDNYVPVAPLDPGPYEQLTPTLQYDTSRYYVLSSLGLKLATVSSRSYDADNKVTGYTQTDTDSTGALTGRKYGTVAYATGTNIANVMEYTDTSAAFSGMYQLTTRMNADYTGNDRTVDTTRYWYVPSGTGVMGNNYTYNTSGQLTVRLGRMQDQSSGMWMDNNRSTYTYDAAGRLQKRADETWTGSAWSLFTIDTFGYSGSNPNYVYHRSTSYGENDTFVVLENATLNAAGAWDELDLSIVFGGFEIPAAMYKMFYNANNHLTSYKDVTPGSSGSEARFYYAPASGTGVADVRRADAAFANIFPNPAGNDATINIANPQGRVNVAITNMAGQMLSQQSSPAAASVALNTASLPACSYHVTVTMNGAVQTLKLVKQ